MGLGTLNEGAGGRPMAEINMVPLIDVMLVLVVVFLVTAPLLTHQVKLELPRASSAPNAGRAEHVEIAIRSDGQFHWEGEALSRIELENRAAQLGAASPDAEVHFRGDAAVPYGEVAWAIAVLARNGLVRIGFVTDPNEGAAFAGARDAP